MWTTCDTRVTCVFGVQTLAELDNSDDDSVEDSEVDSDEGQDVDFDEVQRRATVLPLEPCHLCCGLSAAVTLHVVTMPRSRL